MGVIHVVVYESGPLAHFLEETIINKGNPVINVWPRVVSVLILYLVEQWGFNRFSCLGLWNNAHSIFRDTQLIDFQALYGMYIITIFYCFLKGHTFNSSNEHQNGWTNKPIKKIGKPLTHYLRGAVLQLVLIHAVVVVVSVGDGTRSAAEMRCLLP